MHWSEFWLEIEFTLAGSVEKKLMKEIWATLKEAARSGEVAGGTSHSLKPLLPLEQGDKGKLCY